jgi:hypothetical protein
MNDLEVDGNRHLNHLMRSGVCAEGVDRILRAVRKHLGMDIAFVSHFGAPNGCSSIWTVFRAGRSIKARAFPCRRDTA